MDNINKDLKKKIQDYWTEHVPRFNQGEGSSVETVEFYNRIDKSKYEGEPYVFKSIDNVIKKGKKVLEVGIGLGTDLRYFANKGMRAYGVDLSPSNASLVCKGFKVNKLDGYALAADAEQLPFPDKTFDLFYSYGVLHHTPNTEKAIEEAYRVLKDDGVFLIMLYHKGLAYRWIYMQYMWLKLLGKKKSLSEMITNRYDHTPLSKMYSRSQARSLFRQFNDVKISVQTYGEVKNNKKLFWVYYLLKLSPFLMDKFGSFLIIRGNKSQWYKAQG